MGGIGVYAIFGEIGDSQRRWRLIREVLFICWLEWSEVDRWIVDLFKHSYGYIRYRYRFNRDRDREEQWINTFLVYVYYGD